jgi:hypothetical protein
MKIVKKIWLWVFEFKLKRVADDKKIAFLLKELLEELESQGKDLNGLGCGYVTIWIHGNNAKIENSFKNWKIDCGKYERKIKDSDDYGKL